MTTLRIFPDGSYQLWPSPEWTAELVEAYVNGVISWAGVGEVYKAWREETLNKLKHDHRMPGLH